MKSQTMDKSLGFGVSTKPGINLGQTKMKKLRKDQRGFSMLELLLVIAITGMITAAITTTVFQVFNMNARTANQMIAVSQVQQAGKLVSQDVLQAQTVDTDSEFLTLTWADWATGDEHEVIYTLVDVASSELKILWREHKKNSVLESSSLVAEYIDPNQTNCVTQPEDAEPEDVDVLIFTVTATVGDESEQRIYKVQPRPGS